MTDPELRQRHVWASLGDERPWPTVVAIDSKIGRLLENPHIDAVTITYAADTGRSPLTYYRNEPKGSDG